MVFEEPGLGQASQDYDMILSEEIPYEFGHKGPIVRRHFQRLAVAEGLLVICFGRPLLEWFSFAWNSELFS